MADENRSEIDINISVCGSRLNLIRFATIFSSLGVIFSLSSILTGIGTIVSVDFRHLICSWDPLYPCHGGWNLSVPLCYGLMVPVTPLLAAWSWLLLHTSRRRNNISGVEKATKIYNYVVYFFFEIPGGLLLICGCVLGLLVLGIHYGDRRKTKPPEPHYLLLGGNIGGVIGGIMILLFGWMKFEAIRMKNNSVLYAYIIYRYILYAVSIIFLVPLFSFLIYQHHNLPFLVPLAIGCPLFALDIGPLLILHTIRSQRDNQTSGIQVQNVKHQATPIRGLVVGVIVGLVTYCMLSINFKSLMKIN